MAKLKTGRYTSSIKELRKSKKQEFANTKVLSSIRQIIRKLKKCLLKKDTETSRQILSEAFSLLDKASKKNILHKNAVNRKKTQLSKLVNKSISTQI